MKNTLNYKIAENLRFEIKNCGKTRKEIAIEIGVSTSALSDYISGRRFPTLATLSRLCNFIDCSADDILEIKLK